MPALYFCIPHESSRSWWNPSSPVPQVDIIFYNPRRGTRYTVEKAQRQKDGLSLAFSTVTMNSFVGPFLLSIVGIMYICMCICIKLHIYIHMHTYARVWVKTDGHVPLELDGFIVKLIGMSWPVAPKWPLGGVRDRQQWTVWCPILREIGGHHTPSGVIQQNFARVILCHLCKKKWGREWST